MLQILCSSVRAKLHVLAKLIFLGEQRDDFFSVGNPGYTSCSFTWISIVSPDLDIHLILFSIQ